VDIVPELVEHWSIDRVLAHRWVEPFGRERDSRLKRVLGARFELVEGEMLAPPESLRTGKGTPYGVFTPFAKQFMKAIHVGETLPQIGALPSLPNLANYPLSEAVPTCQDLGFDRNSQVIRGGESQAIERLDNFLKANVSSYMESRDRMDQEGTSRLSADLKFGTLSIRTVWNRLLADQAQGPGVRGYLNQLLWREFVHSTLWDRPELLEEPYRPAFQGFPWREDASAWNAWVSGTTGYPVVDASARQLLGEGFVHNRARMISASFLTKHLLIDYRQGEAHYLKYLVDGDWAQNNAGWQWSAGCGCDGQPYFRVFNPFTQGEKFDPHGDYVRRWVPELAHMPARYIHRPWDAPENVLADAGVRLGANYPKPIVDHKLARERYLEIAKGHLKGSR